LFKKLTLKNGKIWSKIKRPIALLLSLIIVFGFVIFLLVLIIPELKNAVTIFIDNIPIYQEKVIDLANKLNLSNDTIQIIKNGWENLTDSLFSFLKNNSKDFIQMTLGITTSIVSGIMNFILGLVFAIYMLADKEKLIKQTKKLLYALLPKKKVEKVLYVTTVSNRVFSKFITGQVTEAVIIGLLCFIGMLILHLPYASTISVLVGFTALIPVFGAFIGTAIGAILIFVVDPLGALIFITYIIILQQFEGNLIYPKVVGSSVGLPGIWVMLAVIIGGSLYGIVGMLLSVPICSILYVLLAKKVNEKLKKIKQNIN
ncbi:MAG: AI-2E family transporter, partial [Bacilli bacterium]